MFSSEEIAATYINHLNLNFTKRVILAVFCCFISVVTFANSVDSKTSTNPDNSFVKQLSKTASNDVFFSCVAVASVTCGSITIEYEVTAGTCAEAGAIAGGLADKTECLD